MDLKEFDEELNPYEICDILTTLIHNQGELVKAVSELMKKDALIPQVPRSRFIKEGEKK